ncbi:MAG: PAS domain-containing protein [Burkholderiales bacterium]|nr:PAS domain-containing protein [Burkholderiales bacterium]
MGFTVQQPAADATRALEHRYHDGRTAILYVSDRERPYPAGRLIISRTDLDGIITHCNEAFVEISGYERDELIGQPQSVLRHPDMPQAAYEDLWRTLRAGNKWHGYIKNLCKDGSHYWVYATAVPNKRNGQVVGYTSVRREPSRRKIDEAEALYKQLLAKEGGAS